MYKKLVGVMSLSIMILTIAACGNVDTNSSGGNGHLQEETEPLHIYTTVYPLQFFAEQIAGDEALVESILPPGSNPHNYEPTTEDIVELAESDAFIYIGAGLEPYAESISESIKSEDVKIVAASNNLELIDHIHDHEEEHSHEEEEADHHDEEDQHDHGDKDPHVWLEPVLSIKVAETIKETLVELNPGKEEEFNRNFEKLKENLENLDSEFRSQLEPLPGNKIIVSHAAYGYWERAYGIEQIAVSGLSPTNEPSQKDIKDIIEVAEHYELKHVFFEQNVTLKVADVVRKEIGAEALQIHNLSVLTDEDIDNNEDYFSLMRKNLETLTKALSIASTAKSSEHTHSHDEESEKIHEGYFEDSQIKDRSLSDWEGDWQSVYPYLQDGTLDEVFAHKAEHNDDKTADEYKEYYQVGYQTDVDRIIISEGTVTFYENGQENSGEYVYDGYEILTYEKGNRGVRFIFKRVEEAEELPQYIQFSDHSIYPTKADHYHLYWGDDREALLEEVTNWPTYYPSEMNGEEIADEMMAH
ncbi:ZinT/AdcA family metal-binding protein [Bacillus sp. YZJH907-2]|uniref:ZinT/AdcA family metal-binding protein n=1 Tax=Halalkalibacter suaedae TaxID=2822140 RepID=A0A941ATG4_9BACI|nr:ZinT/AdcA family metal-binding protein [Bacillus suaedae]